MPTIEPVHEELVELVGWATARMLKTAGRLTSSEIRYPSALPGWSRGHVFTHLAQNAEGLTRLILASQSGYTLPMYASAAARDSDIEAGASRDGSVIVEHVQLACATLDATVSTVSNWAATTVFATVSGPTEKPLLEVLSMRLREVAIHHVDLDVAHTFDSEDPRVINELVRNAADRMSSQVDVRIELRVDGVSVATIAPESSGEPTVVDLSGAAMLGWLTGRDEPRPDLPRLPDWG